ncbi:MAG: protein kinase [Bryobacteraceae bacterium]|nr:protein kinase [Bryobacteraceae bacterium]
MISQRLGHYEVTGRLGTGGMGEVWKAHDTRLHRDVALKVLSAEWRDDPARRHRFAKEARAASALNHPNIVTIYAIEREEEFDYMVMECVEGRTLRELIGPRGLPLSLALEIALQIAGALAVAHRAGIVHRDLKPGNIMVRGDGLVKILDFGLAKRLALSPDAEGTMSIAGAGLVSGTVSYMSPEQASGAEVDHRSDIFSLGVVLYEMLSGQRPFPGDNPLSVLQKIHTVNPTPVARLRPGLPPPIDQLLSQALEKNAERRLQSMEQFADELRALSEYESATAATDTLTLDSYPAMPRPAAPERRRVPLVVLWAVAALVIAAGLWLLASRYGADVARDRWFGPGPHELTEKARALLREHYKPGHVDQSIEALKQALDLDENYASAHAALAGAYVQRYRERADQQWARMALDEARRAVELTPQLAAAQLSLGRALHMNGKLEDAERAMRRALDLDPRSAEVRCYLSQVLETSRREEAEAVLHEAIRLEPKSALAHVQLGALYARLGRLEEAREALEKGLQLEPTHALALRNLSAVYHLLGRHEDAIGAVQRSLEITPDSAAAHSNLGTLLFFQGRFRDAVSAMEKAVDHGAGDFVYWGNLADAYKWTAGLEKKAPETYQLAARLAAGRLKSHPEDDRARASLALYLAKQGRKQEATTAAAGLEPRTFPVLYALLLVNELCGRRGDALRLLERLVDGGHSMYELENDPELLELRRDPAYHRVMARRGAPLGKR